MSLRKAKKFRRQAIRIIEEEHRTSMYWIMRMSLKKRIFWACKILKGEKCEFCGNQAENFLFAAFICDSDECEKKARERRGGPGGHLLDKYRRKNG